MIVGAKEHSSLTPGAGKVGGDTLVHELVYALQEAQLVFGVGKDAIRSSDSVAGETEGYAIEYRHREYRGASKSEQIAWR